MSMRRWWFGIGLLAASLFCAGTVRADAVSDARKAIQVQYDRSNSAAARKEIKGSMAIFTLDFVQVDRKGVEHDLPDVREHTLKVFELSTSITGTTAIQTITVSGSTATIRVKEHGT